ncbi:MAG TPA: hypothetical protein PKA88_14240 [Polyangiaceae bacterium]|nr:hypothetical protein [Polyangiaceae bacterium]
MSFRCLAKSFVRLGPPLAALVVFAALFTWAEPASAYTWMIRHGYGGCNVCHADPSGGELLTAYGRTQGDLILRMRYGKDNLSAQSSATESESTDSFDDFDDFDSEPKGKEAGDDDVSKAKAGKTDVEDLDETDAADGDKKKKKKKKKKTPDEAASDEELSASDSDNPGTGFLWGLIDLPDALLLSGSYRHVSLLKGGEFRNFPMQADLYGQLTLGSIRIGGSVGAARVPAGSPHARGAQITSNQGEEFNAISRTHRVGFDFGKSRQVTLRAGRLNLPFGVRIPEHVMWVREVTRTDRESDQHHGASISYNGSLFRGEAMLVAGNYQVNPDRYRERGYSMYVETLVTEPFATGVSSLMTFSAADVITLEEESTARGTHGVFFRVKVSEPVVLLFEADALHKSRRELGYVAFTQLDYEPVQGLHLGATGEILDKGYKPEESSVPGIDVPRVAGTGKPRLGGWLTVDWFFLPQLELRVDAVLRQEDPFLLMGQLHVYL